MRISPWREAQSVGSGLVYGSLVTTYYPSLGWRQLWVALAMIGIIAIIRVRIGDQHYY